MSLVIRDYQPTDQAACLEVFEPNIPKYFSTDEREEFAQFLDKPSCVYLLLEDSGKVLGCGGYYIAPDRQEACLCWGMVHNQYHSTGLGKRLLLERLNRITQHLEVTFIRLDTSQYTFGFFEKLGFVTQKITLSGYWPGLDRYDMKLSLDVAVQPRLQSIYQGVWP